MSTPFHPIIYVRGYAMTPGEIDQTSADPFCGFNLGMAGGGFISAKLIPAFGWHSLLLIGGVLPLILAVLYALALYHDENGNRSFDRTGVGFPAEGFGFSNNPATLADMGIKDSYTIDEVNALLASFDGKLSGFEQQIRYARFCNFRGVRSLHLVLDTKDGPVTVFVLPKDHGWPANR